MVVGILQVELVIDGSTSLKDKRRVVTSIKDRLHREHQVSVAETGSLDDHRKAMIGIAMASNEVPYCQSVMDRIVDKLRTQRGCFLNDYTTEIIAPQ